MEHKPPIVSGQCAQVLNLIRECQPILSMTMTADHAIPEAAARVHDLRDGVQRPDDHSFIGDFSRCRAPECAAPRAPLDRRSGAVREAS